MVNPFALGISKIDETDDIEAQELKNYYKDWRQYNRNINAPFFPLDNNFKDRYLKDIEGGPLKLYLYFAFHANNKEGHSWHSVNTISEFFGIKTRTVDNWIKSLVEAGLIYRQRDGKKTASTFLLPLSNSVRLLPKPENYKENQFLVDYYISHLEKARNVYGEIVAVTHLFQWTNISSENLKSRQAIAFLTKRDNIYVLHLCSLQNTRQNCVNELSIEENRYFESDFNYRGEKMLGLAYPSKVAFSAFKSLKKLIEALVEISQVSLEEIGGIMEEIQFGSYRDELIEITKEIEKHETKEDVE